MSAKTNERTDKMESWHGLGEIGKRERFQEMGNTRFVVPLFENFPYIKKNHIFSLLFNKIMFI
jgi:hypothetical protein